MVSGLSPLRAVQAKVVGAQNYVPALTVAEDFVPFDPVRVSAAPEVPPPSRPLFLSHCALLI